MLRRRLHSSFDSINSQLQIAFGGQLIQHEAVGAATRLCPWRDSIRVLYTVDTRRSPNKVSTLSTTSLHPSTRLEICVSMSVDAIERLAACLVDAEAWLRVSRLRLNATKAQVMLLGSSSQLARLGIPQVHLLSSSIPVHTRPVITVLSGIGCHLSVETATTHPIAV